MRVSVVIPAYNAADTVGDAIESVLAQTVHVDEIIVVDDGSTDETGALVEQKYAQVRLIRQANRGPSAARNAGLAAANGEWVAMLDADDRWHPRKLADQFAVASEQPGVVLVASDWMRWPGPSSPPPAPVSRTQFTASDLLILNRFQTSTVLMRTDTVRAVGGFDARLDGAEDWDMWLRMAKRGEIVKLDWPYVTYRDVASGYSKDLSRVYRTMCLMLDRECAESTLPAAHVGAVVAWHHLRFVVGFLLLKDFAGARLALGGLGRHRVRRYAPTAATRFLLPFLAGRVARRLPRRRR